MLFVIVDRASVSSHPLTIANNTRIYHSHHFQKMLRENTDNSQLDKQKVTNPSGLDRKKVKFEESQQSGCICPNKGKCVRLGTGTMRHAAGVAAQAIFPRLQAVT